MAGDTLEARANELRNAGRALSDFPILTRASKAQELVADVADFLVELAARVDRIEGGGGGAS